MIVPVRGNFVKDSVFRESMGGFYGSVGADESRFAGRDGWVKAGSDPHLRETRLIKAGGDTGDRGIEPFPNRAEGIMVEGIHPNVIETLPFLIGIPAFPDGGGTVLDHVTPRREFFAVQKFIGKLRLPKFNEDFQEVLGGMESGGQVAEFTDLAHEIPLCF